MRKFFISATFAVATIVLAACGMGGTSKQTTADDGDIVIVTVNGTDATCKQFKRYQDGIALVSINPAYPPMYYTAQEVDQLPVCIIGKVVELRAKM